MLEVAGVYTRAADEPGRSVYFVATAAEERGLLGSEYFVRHPPIPVDQMAANLNLDSMNVYGSSESLVLLGAERSSLGALVTEVARQSDRVVGSDAHPERGSFFRSDHFSFARAGVPALSLASGDPSGYRGPNADTARSLAAEYNARHYHQPSDEVSAEWDWTGAVEDARLMADLGWRVAADPRMPSYHRGDQFAAPRGKGTQP
jgi:Zn-dependent M28 family amino/carboxypeptidase